MEQFDSDPGGIPKPDLGSTESNRRPAVRWFHEGWVERRTETIDELWAPGAIGHMENGDQGMAEFKTVHEGLLSAFPDIQVEVSRRRPRCRALARPRGHRDDGLGLPPTNRKVDFRGMTWLTFKNGVIVEGWDPWNLGRLLESLRRSDV